MIFRGGDGLYVGEWPAEGVPAISRVVGRIEAGPRHGPTLFAGIDELGAIDHPLARALYVREAMRVTEGGVTLAGLSRETARRVALRALGEPPIAVGDEHEDPAEVVRRAQAWPYPHVRAVEMRLLAVCSEPADIELFRRALADAEPPGGSGCEVADLLRNVERDHPGLLARAGLGEPLAAFARRQSDAVDRSSVLHALAYCGPAALAELATIAAADPDPEVRGAAADALARARRVAG